MMETGRIQKNLYQGWANFIAKGPDYGVTGVL
jgi:hypothetical protein